MKEKAPTVSIVIPTYNRAHLVGRSVKSVLNQNYQDFEIIIVDDGSSDNTEDVIEKFQEQDDRIKYIRHKTNRGGAVARNTGIQAAKGKYIAFQDSDDTWEPEKLEKQMRVFEHALAEVGVVYTDMWRRREGKRKYIPSPEIKPEEGIVYKQALIRVLGIGIGTAMIKRECFNRVGMFDESLHRFIDLELFVRLSKYYYFQHIKEPLINYYDAGKRISGNDEALIEANELILKKHSHDITGDKKSWAEFQYRMANILCQNGNTGRWKYYLLNAVKADPFNIKYLIAVFISLFGNSAYNKMIKLWLRIQDANTGYKEE